MLNELNWEELFYLETSLEILHNKEYQCILCKNKYKDEKMNMKVRKIKGCFDISEQIRTEINGGRYRFEFYSCPGNYFDPQFYYWLEIWQAYKKGIQVHEGPISKWPAKLMEIINVIENKNNTIQEEKRVKAEREYKRKSRSR